MRLSGPGRLLRWSSHQPARGLDRGGTLLWLELSALRSRVSGDVASDYMALP